MFGPPLPTLSDPFSSVTVLAPAIGSDGFTDAPSGGASAAAGSYSAALLGLNVKAEATFLRRSSLLRRDIAATRRIGLRRPADGCSTVANRGPVLGAFR